MLAGFDFYCSTFPPISLSKKGPPGGQFRGNIPNEFFVTFFIKKICTKMVKNLPLHKTAAIELVHKSGSGIAVAYNYVQSNQNSRDFQSTYLQTFQRIECLLQHHIVFEPTCVCEPLNKESAP
jgi:hypothetical protein